jgi:hypothetical protein
MPIDWDLPPLMMDAGAGDLPSADTLDFLRFAPLLLFFIFFSILLSIYNL